MHYGRFLNVIDETAFDYIKAFLRNNDLSFHVNTSTVLILVVFMFYHIHSFHHLLFK